MNDRIDPALAGEMPRAVPADAPVAQLPEIFDAQRAAFAADMSPSREARVDRLDRLLRLTEEHQGEIADAISADFGHRSRHETDLADIFIVISAIRQTRRHVGRWMKPRQRRDAVAAAAGAQRGRSRSRSASSASSARGTIRSSSRCCPAAAALAAGNRVMLKPSELTPRFSALLQRIVAESFAAGRVRGRFPATSRSGARSRQPAVRPSVLHRIDGRRPPGGAGCRAEPHAGHARARRQVAGDHRRRLRHRRCGARGSPSPSFSTPGRPAWRPITCWCRARASTSSWRRCGDAVAAMYPSFCRQPRLHEHRERPALSTALPAGRRRAARAARRRSVSAPAGARRRCRGPQVRADAARRRRRRHGRDATRRSSGPLLPIVPYDTLDEAIAYVNASPRPLALYWFGRNGARRDHVLRSTISGGVTINDACWHVARRTCRSAASVRAAWAPITASTASGRSPRRSRCCTRRGSTAFGLFRPPYGRRFETVIALAQALLLNTPDDIAGHQERRCSKD